MMDLYLRAPDEAALIEALPMLRGEDENGDPGWQIAGTHHALDVGFTVIREPGIYSANGREEQPPVIAEGFHANLRLLDGHPDHDAILAACEPFSVKPANPVHQFSGSAA